MDGFLCLGYLNNHINLLNMIGSVVGGTNYLLVEINGIKFIIKWILRQNYSANNLRHEQQKNACTLWLALMGTSKTK